ncbi:homocitrate synthase/isopropylmalate synthase family protein [Nostoc sp.]|uniref:homocitrate synthase/isopropylmalate synthase family protein n=1 Tax=Nostoc sp. TaxID=1180 RepID=UPI002FF86397
MIRDDIILENTTLRDGEQAAGVAFSKASKLAIHDYLVATGVRWIEAGIPAMGDEDLDTLKTMIARGSDATLVAWNRGVKEEVALSLDIGFKAVHIGLPTSNVHLKDSIGQDRHWLLEQAKNLIKYAKDRGAFVSISAEDVGRTEIPFLQEYACIVTEAGADRLRLSDTIGILTPEAYAERVQSVVKVSSIDVQCHTHNDFGLAVANTLAGLNAGARYFHVNVFAHESGIHAKGMLKNNKTFEPFSPEEVGGERKYIIGKHSGRAILNHLLQEQGVTVDETQLGDCLRQVRALAIEQGGSVSPEQLRDIYFRISKERVA